MNDDIPEGIRRDKNNKAPFMVGEVVTCGGVRMTVLSASETRVECAWSFEDDIEAAAFPPEALSLATNPPASPPSWVPPWVSKS